MTDPGDAGSQTRPPGAATRRTVLKTLSAGVGLATIGGTVSSAASDGYWTVVALPDTQYYARDERFGREQTEWIVDNLDEENIAFVSHEGDVVHNADSDAEWEYMDDAMSLLDGQVPYATVPGNHEYEVWWDRSSSIQNYKQHFGPDNFADRDWYGGAGPTNGDPNRDELNSYQLFSAGGYDFLHLALEWEAPGSVDDPDTPLGWAQSILDQYPDRPTILTTHSYLRDDTEDWSTTVQEANENGNTGTTVWETLVKPNPQVFMTLCGHWFNDDGEYRQVSTNDAGSAVYEMLANFQGRYKQGYGYLRRIEFRPGEGSDASDRIQVRSYSPVLDEYYDDADSEFAFDLDFDERFDVSSDSDSDSDSDSEGDESTEDDSSVTTGDADGDGDVDDDDVEVVQQHIADEDVDIDTEAADVDGDGDVDIGDAVSIRNKSKGE